MANARPRLLFLAPRYPEPPERGDQRRVLHLARGLARHADVTMLTFGSGPTVEENGLRIKGVAQGALDTVAGNLAAPDPRLPLQTRLFLSARLSRALRTELARRPAVIHITLARLGPYLPPPGPWHRHIDLIDALSLNMRTRARAMGSLVRLPFSLEARLLAAYEARCVARADSASVVSEEDRAWGPGLQQAHVVPNGVDLDAFPYLTPIQREPVLLFFGNLGYFHNVAPARYVAEEILPRVRAQVPRTVLRLAGARPAPAVRALGRLPGVSVVGPVADMAEELHRAAAAVVPMFSGSGMKNKVLEAFSAGTPVVSNALGIQGVHGAQPGEHLLCAEDADRLAESCVALLRDADLRVLLARGARSLVEREFSWEARVDQLRDLYGQALR